MKVPVPSMPRLVSIAAIRIDESASQPLVHQAALAPLIIQPCPPAEGTARTRKPMSGRPKLKMSEPASGSVIVGAAVFALGVLDVLLEVLAVRAVTVAEPERCNQRGCNRCDQHLAGEADAGIGELALHEEVGGRRQA